ncbi:MAG: uroporphyrinogen-III synthase [Acidimicrobiales bacterium]
MSERPLGGVRVVVTRPRAQAAALVDALEGLGAEAVPVPVIEIVDPPDGGAALRAALADLKDGDWLVLTSPNGVTRAAAAMAGRLPAGVSVAVIGPGTRRRAEAAGLPVHLEPSSSIAEGLLAALPEPSGAGATMVLARAAQARAVLPDGLAGRGWVVRDVPAYETVAVPVAPPDRQACRHADVVAFTSASTVQHLVGGVGADNLPPVIACIGPATADAVVTLGLTPDIVATEHTIDGLVAAVVDDLADRVLLRPEAADHPDSQWMLEQYFDEIDARFETGLDRDGILSTHPEEISPPHGLFVVARLAGEPVGCGALKVTAPAVADLKRMWVSDRVRGRGVGRGLLRRLVAEARALGMRQVRLDTNRALTEAIALYRSEGSWRSRPSTMSRTPTCGSRSISPRRTSRTTVPPRQRATDTRRRAPCATLERWSASNRSPRRTSSSGCSTSSHRCCANGESSAGPTGSIVTAG